MATTTLTQVPPGVQAFYDRNLLTRAVPADIHGRFGQTRTIPTNGGNQIKFRRYSALTPATTPLTEGVTPAGSSLAVTDITATLAQYGDFVTLSDMVDLTNQDSVLTEAGKVLGEQAGTTVDQIRRDVLVAGTNVFYANGAARASVNTAMSAALLKTAIRFLKRQNAKFIREMIKGSTGIATQPIRPAYVGLIHPDTEAVLEGITGYIPVTNYSAQMDVMENECGSFQNIRFVVSTNGKVFADAGAAKGTMISTTGTNADVYATLIVAADAYGVCPLAGNAMKNIIKALGSAGSADPLDQRASSGWKATTTTKILNDAWLCRLEHANTDTLS
ncbi:N4-gp56 family major capsid protein [Cupriavidus necator]|uniref:N4-gp56 family major capsid protein n=1 Tax=Cupriavidus necator TaxID=106590 RepID=UPI00148FDB56|nr:N4-gp56 family major capsid protein [Cupriavidus necator]NOV28017.1 N4-gp56 family major capsid protein [Cupriavidus necator]